MLVNLLAGVVSENETLVAILLGVDTAILAFLLVCCIVWAIVKFSRRKRAKNNKAAADETPEYTLVPKGMMLLPVGYKGAALRETAVNEGAATAVVVQADENSVIVPKASRKTLDENYAELSQEQKGFFDGLLAYGMGKENAEENRTKTEVQVKADKKSVMRLTVKRGITVAKFHLENDLVKQYRKNDAESKIAVKDTEIKVIDVAAYETAKGLIDVAIENNRREKEAAAETRRRQRAERRRAAKLASE
ncbi:MAG: hypothetical protein IJQ87_00080 [Clostridia bacterium]|nr:hypothetical protein [Clostridia bacterium]